MSPYPKGGVGCMIIMHSYLDACIYDIEDKKANSKDCNY